MPYIVRDHRLLFYSAPATGSTAIINALSSALGGAYYPEEDVVEGDRRITPRKHATPAQMRAGGLMTPEIESFTAAVGIRNPFSFHVAKYLRNKTRRLKQVKKPNSWINKLPEADRARYVRQIERSAQMSFGEYLRHELSRLKAPTAVQAGFHEGVEVFIHQESTQADLDKLRDRLGIDKEIPVAKVNVTGAMKAKETYHDYYTPDLIDLVHQWNAPSFEKFPEYSFEGYDAAKC